MFRKENWGKSLRSALLGIFGVAVLLMATTQAEKYVKTNDIRSHQNETVIQLINHVSPKNDSPNGASGAGEFIKEFSLYSPW